MKKIIIAGCGHGGLVAGAKLAQKGYDVCIIEQQSRENLGHDWEDRFSFPVLQRLIEMDKLPEDIWRYRGDCAFVSPAHNTKVLIKYTNETRQKVMWRKPLINLLIDYAVKSGVKFIFNTKINGPIVEKDYVVGIDTEAGPFNGDLVIDAAGVFSPVRSNLPEKFKIEKEPKYGDLFYAYRAYFNLLEGYEKPEYPFEVYMYHEGEQGLSWHLTNEKTVDILIGRIYKFGEEKVKEQLDIFKKNHPWTGDEIVHGGNYGIIPVRRPLTLMVANGYAACGDSAFMTTPMNGMGIDLSMLAGELLANTIINAKDYSVSSLWKYNKEFHVQYGGDTAKNEGLKNAILSMPSVGVDFLFDNAVIQSSDLAGAGRNTKLSALLGKAVRGMKEPKYFLALIKGLIKGGKASGLYKKAPEDFDFEKVVEWSNKISALDIRLG